MLWAPPDSVRGGQAVGSTKAADGSVVARVNGEPVTRAEFQRMLGNPLTRRELQLKLGEEQPDPQQLERLALRKAIHHRLMLQEAARRNIAVTGAELDKAIASLRRRFDDLGDFGRWMTDQGLDDRALFEAVRGDMLAGRVWAALAQGVRVSEEQAQQYYDSHRGELASGEEVRLRIIAVKDKPAAEEALASLRKGASFAQVARRRSEGARAAQGGDTGWVDSRSLPEPLQKAVPRLKPGDVAGPLDNGASGFLLVGLEGRRPIPATSLKEARPQIEQRLLPVQQQAAVEKWLSEQELQSNIEVFLPAGSSSSIQAGEASSRSEPGARRRSRHEGEQRIPGT
jgi:parvulin-like peptidyl-prolyl isomerase